MIWIKRAYDPPQPQDGRRFLVDRLWPRGVRKEEAEVDRWAKDVAPSDELRRWFDHRAERWEEFRRRYLAELDENPEAWRPLLRGAEEGRITLVYAAQDREHNNAVVLKEYLEAKLAEG